MTDKTDKVKSISKKYGFDVTFRHGIAIYMSYNSVNHNGNIHSAVIVDMTVQKLDVECTRKAEELKTFIANNS